MAVLFDSHGELARLVVACVWALAVAALLWRAVTQFRAYRTVAPSRDLADAAAPEIAVIVPARDEAAMIARCLGSLLAQDYPAGRLRIVVVDDNSADETAAIVGRMASRETAGTLPRLTLLSGRALPPGWAGKPHACWQGALAAEAEWLCFLDADTCAEPALLRSALAAALADRADMLSLEPFQELGSFWERLIIPAGMFALACVGDIRSTNDGNLSEAAVNGQFLLVRRSAYFASGGHAAVRSEICEDSALARRVKQAGFRLRLLGAERLVRTRMYADLRGLWEGLVKNTTDVFGGTAPTIAVAVGGLVVGWAALALPLWTGLAMAGAPGWTGLVAFALAALASLAVLATEIAGARHFRIPAWYGFLFPLGYTAGALLATTSVIAHARGRVAWKGRVYTVPHKAPHAEP